MGKMNFLTLSPISWDISYFLFQQTFPSRTNWFRRVQRILVPGRLSEDWLQSVSISFLNWNNTVWLDTTAIHAGEGKVIEALNNLLNRIRKKKEITGQWKNGLFVSEIAEERTGAIAKTGSRGSRCR